MDLKDLQLIGQGNTAQIYSLGEDKVLKLFYEGFNTDAVKEEYEKSVIVQNILACVPKAYEMVNVDGRDGIVYQRVSGQDMLQTIMKKPWLGSKLSREFARYHIGLQKPVKENLITVKDKLGYDIDAAGLDEETRSILKEYLKKLPDGERLCHFDFHPGNIMMEEDKVILLDWMTACKGDACADAARTGILLKFAQLDGLPVAVQKILAISKRIMWKDYSKEYRKLTGISKADIAKWEVPVAAARLREKVTDKEREALLKYVMSQLPKLR